MRAAGLAAIGGCALLGAALALWPQADGGPGPEPASAPAPAASAVPTSPPPPAGAASAQIHFAPEGAAPALPPKAPEPPVLVGLAGIGAPTAYLADGAASGRVGLGGAFQGWRLTAIGSRSVRVQRGRERLTLSLFSPRAALSSAAPAQSPPFALQAALASAPPSSAAPPSTAEAAPPPPAVPRRVWPIPGFVPPKYVPMRNAYTFLPPSGGH